MVNSSTILNFFAIEPWQAQLLLATLRAGVLRLWSILELTVLRIGKMINSGIYVLAIERWQGNGKLLDNGLFQKQPTPKFS
jgi:hypothetical protein